MACHVLPIDNQVFEENIYKVGTVYRFPYPKSKGIFSYRFCKDMVVKIHGRIDDTLYSITGRITSVINDSFVDFVVVDIVTYQVRLNRKRVSND